VVAERGPGNDLEDLLLDARDREVALDSASAIEHLRVGDRPDPPSDGVVAQAFEQHRGARSAQFQLCER
jgi:hypothetical protein